MNGYIYKITNKINDKIYVGMSCNPQNRWKYGHILTAKNIIAGKTTCYKSLLYDAMKKYGIENFSMSIIEECPLDTMGQREQYWIDKLDSRNPLVGYNICRGGCRGPGGPMFAGHHHSIETRKKMSENRQGKNNSNYGNRWKQSYELRKLHSKLSSGENNGMYGKKHTEESKLKNSLSHKGRKKMSHVSIYPKYKMIPMHEIECYISQGWYLTKSN